MPIPAALGSASIATLDAAPVLKGAGEIGQRRGIGSTVGPIAKSLRTSGNGGVRGERGVRKVGEVGDLLRRQCQISDKERKEAAKGYENKRGKYIEKTRGQRKRKRGSFGQS